MKASPLLAKFTCLICIYVKQRVSVRTASSHILLPIVHSFLYIPFLDLYFNIFKQCFINLTNSIAFLYKNNGLAIIKVLIVSLFLCPKSFSSLYKGLDFNLLPYKKMFYLSHVFGLFLIKIIIINIHQYCCFTLYVLLWNSFFFYQCLSNV